MTTDPKTTNIYWELICDCLREQGWTFGSEVHCSDISGKRRGCHETFSDEEVYREHIHGATGGCRYPGNIEDSYESEGIWYKKEPKKEEDIIDQFPSSKPTRNVGKRSTSRGSKNKQLRTDQQSGRSWEGLSMTQR